MVLFLKILILLDYYSNFKKERLNFSDDFYEFACGHRIFVSEEAENTLKVTIGASNHFSLLDERIKAELRGMLNLICDYFLYYPYNGLAKSLF